jgi:hypothetical protein
VRKAICDTSPLQYLHQIGFLHLLAEFYAETLIPPAVVSELERGKAIGVDLPDVRELPWLKIQARRGWTRYPRWQIWAPARSKCWRWDCSFQAPL